MHEVFGLTLLFLLITGHQNLYKCIRYSQNAHKREDEQLVCSCNRVLIVLCNSQINDKLEVTKYRLNIRVSSKKVYNTRTAFLEKLEKKDVIFKYRKQLSLLSQIRDITAILLQTTEIPKLH